MENTSVGSVNEAKLNSFMMKALSELGAALNASLVVVGDKLGLYRAMAGAGPLTPVDLAEKTGLHERYLREWLSAQAAGRFVLYDPNTGKYELPPEQALALADETSHAFLPGLFDLVEAAFLSIPKMTKAFQSGEGVGWHEQHSCLFNGLARINKPNYRKYLVPEWIPSLDGVEEKLRSGARVADIGCGLGVSTILMAKAFPNSRFFGFDYHGESIEAARSAAVAEGVTENASFAVASSKDFPGEDYDLITFFDCLHDMGQPEEVVRRVAGALNHEGACMVVEPFAHDNVEDNLNSVGRIFYTTSTMFCTPAVLAQGYPEALGAQAGVARLSRILEGGGLANVRKSAETPFHLVLEARP